MEPSRGEYNLTYLQQVQGGGRVATMVEVVMLRVTQVEEIVEIAGSAGLLAVLDMHQDVFNRFHNHREIQRLHLVTFPNPDQPDPDP